MSIKVLLADDHNLIRQGLYSMLEKEKDIRVIAQAENGREAVRLSNSLNPDIIILDVNMCDADNDNSLLVLIQRIRIVMEKIWLFLLMDFIPVFFQVLTLKILLWNLVNRRRM